MQIASPMNSIHNFLDVLLFEPRHRKTRIGIACLVYALVLILGSLPGARDEVGKVAPGVVLHSLTYGFISVMLFCGQGRATAGNAAASLLAVAVLGALDEYVQSWFSYRTADWTDWAVDVLACAFGLVVLWSLLRFRGRQVPAAGHPEVARPCRNSMK